MFTWKPIHKETAQRLLKFRDRQDELIQLIQRMEAAGLKTISLKDKDADGNEIPLSEIDPFTFMAVFNRGTTEVNRRANWEALKKEWALEFPLPSDFTGIPIAQNMKSWLFPWAGDRDPSHVEKLWTLFEQGVSGKGIEGVSPDLFDECLALKGVGLTNLTAGLFWVAPEDFLSTDKKNVEFASQSGVEPPKKSFESYRAWMAKVRESIPDDFALISHQAHESVVGWSLSESQLDLLWRRFRVRIPGFEDFENPGETLQENELDYKHRLLDRFNEEFGHERLAQAIEDGQAKEVLADLYKLISKESNLIDYRAWANDLPEDEENLARLLRAFLKAGMEPWSGPLVIDDLIAEIKAAGGKPGWSIMTVFLWLLQPDSYFPVRSSYFRGLAQELGVEFPQKRPTGTLFETLMRFGRVFWSALEPWNPRDWIDVQSFMWCVCPATYGGINSLGKPFDKIFENYAEAETVFTLFRDVLDALGVGEKDGDNPIFCISLTSSNHLVINYGNWAISSWLPRSKVKKDRFSLTFRNDLLPEEGVSELWGEFATQDELPAFVGAQISLAAVESSDDPAWQAFVEGCTEMRERFATWKGTPYRGSHRSELFEMCFDDDAFEKYLTEGLPQPEGEDEADLDVEEVDDSDSAAPQQSWPIFDREEELPKLFIDEARFDHMLELLQRKKNIVLAGAPGTGKTFLASKLAYAILEHKDEFRVRTIQFHQSFSYEDFIMGYRPKEGGGFELRNGVFYEFCEQARSDPDKGYFLVIDEINRGNLSKIFGELMMLIEHDKRDAANAASLAYADPADPPFFVPPNLHLIGSMNTADRSLALVDYALRRRFAFIEMEPGFGHPNFRQWLNEENQLSQAWIDLIVQRMTKLNEEISTDSYNLGPGYRIGHSFFCPAGEIGDPAGWYRDVITYEIFPLLQEYWIDSPEKADGQRKSLLEDLPAS